MRSRPAAGCALVLAAAVPGFAQDTFEPNPSLAQLSADDAYALTSAASLRTAGIGASAIRVDDAGRVLVAGWTFDALRVVRLDADGGLDPTFGVAGVVEIPVGGGGGIGGLEIDSAGRIVVTGTFGDPRADPPVGIPGYAGPVYGAARLLADGSLDTAFAGGGVLELDAASGLIGGLGPAHASGGDGAMLALAEKPSALLRVDHPIVGLVRIAADGTLDTTYGGGFAQIAEISSIPPFFPISYDVQVADFAVDSEGRAVVALQDLNGGAPLGVQRLDAAGAVDPSWSGGYASQIALDGEGRLVGLNDFQLWRILPDDRSDPTFSGDGGATRYEAAGFSGNLSVLSELLAAEQADPNFDGSSLWGDKDFLAVATRADRWALARLVHFHDAKGRLVANGIHLQTIDPADPGAIVSTDHRFPDRSFGGLAGLAISPDGTAAYAFGDSFVLRVDLMKRKALPLPDLRVKWLGWPRAVDLGGGRYRVTAKVRITNASRTDSTAAYGFVGFAPGTYGVPPFPPGDYAIALASGQGSATAGYSWPFAVRARSSVVKRFTWEGGDASTDLAGTSLTIKIACELPDANFADNVATSRTITPVYAPR